MNSGFNVLALPWFGLWRAEDFGKALSEKSITFTCQLVYTNSELREIMKRAQELGLKFKDIDHYRTYLFLELCKKLPEAVYSSIFKYFHVIVQVRDFSKSPTEDYQIATMVPQRYQECSLTQDMLMSLTNK